MTETHTHPPTGGNIPASPYLLTKDAAAYLRMDPRTMERLRRTGAGPKFTKLGRKCGYRVEWLSDWAESRVYTSTAAAKRKGRVAS